MNNSSAIGIMDQAYFVPRQEIISWIQKTIHLEVQKIQDLGSGAVYCQILDAAFGQRVPMNKINWKAKFQYDFINNLKLFQQSMERLGINKKIDIQKLARAKYQDNLQLIQWLKRYVELNGMISEDYNPTERRQNATLFSHSQNKKVLGNSFKANMNFNNFNNTINLSNMNNSFCSKAPITNPKTDRKKVVSNKQNAFGQNNGSSSMSQIKKILMSSQSPQTKLKLINNIAFGYGSETTKIQTQMDNERINQSDQEMVF